MMDIHLQWMSILDGYPYPMDAYPKWIALLLKQNRRLKTKLILFNQDKPPIQIILQDLKEIDVQTNTMTFNEISRDGLILYHI